MSLDTRDWTIARRSALLAGLGDQDLAALIPRPRLVQLQKGRTLFTRGEPAVACFVMIDGWIKLVRQDDASGAEVVIHVVGPGESFAEALIIQNVRYPVSGITASAVRLLRVDTAEVRTLLTTEPRIALALLSGCYRQLHALVDQLERARGWPTRRRVAAFLLGLCERPVGAARIELPHDRTLVAARLGMTLDSLSRALAALADVTVATEGPLVTVGDVAALGAYVRTGRLGRT